MTQTHGLPPHAPVDADESEIENLNQFWNEVNETCDTGATTWEVLVGIYQQYTECLQQSPPDLARAHSLTAKAFHLIAGNEYL